MIGAFRSVFEAKLVKLVKHVYAEKAANLQNSLQVKTCLHKFHIKEDASIDPSVPYTEDSSDTAGQCSGEIFYVFNPPLL